MTTDRELDQLLGAFISLSGASISIVGLNAQKWSLDKEGGAGGWRWCLSLFVYIVGQLVQTAAYAFGSQELVVAMSNLSIVTNAVIAACVFGEPFTVRPPRGWHCSVSILNGWDLGAVFVVVNGTVLVAMFAPPQPQDTYTAQELLDAIQDTEFVIFLGLCTGLVLVLAIILYMPNSITKHIPSACRDSCRQRFPISDRAGGVMIALLSATLACMSVSLSKISVLLIKTTVKGENQFIPVHKHSLTYVFITLFVSLAWLGLAVLNNGLAKYDALFIIPIYYVITTITIMIAGLLLYKTYDNFTALSSSMFTFGVGIALYGVYLMSEDDSASEAPKMRILAEESQPRTELKNGTNESTPHADSLSTEPSPGRSGNAATAASPQYRMDRNAAMHRRVRRLSAVDFVFSEWGREDSNDLHVVSHQAIPVRLRRTNSDPNIGSPSMRALDSPRRKYLEEKHADSPRSLDSSPVRTPLHQSPQQQNHKLFFEAVNEALPASLVSPPAFPSPPLPDSADL